MADYGLLKDTLQFGPAITWLQEDAKDDFFPDPLRFADIAAQSESYLSRRQHRLLQIDSIPHVREFLPKRSRILREAVWLHPSHRLVFLAILHHLLPRIDPKLSNAVYSYRLDKPDDRDAYPFGDRMDRWKRFRNDFREAALDESAGAVLITDLSSFFDHISCEQLCLRLRSLLGANATSADDGVLRLLERLLKMHSIDGFGIPQNYDPSSFIGSTYLHNVDQEVTSEGYQYFRWIDDIRIVTPSYEDAIRALHHLQKALAQYRLFLATDKTEILRKGEPRFLQLMDVEDDQILSEAEEATRTGDRVQLKATLEILFERLKHHSGPAGDDRKFRAFANRILDVGDYEELGEDVSTRLREFVLPRLTTHPERSDVWAKLLASKTDASLWTCSADHLRSPKRLFDWQDFHLWRLAVQCPKPAPAELIACARTEAARSSSELVRAQAIVFLGKHGDNAMREELFNKYFSTNRGYPVQRAALIALQELPGAQRSRFYRRAAETNPDHAELITHLEGLPEAFYGERYRSRRKLSDPAKKVESRVTRGIGLRKGQVIRFRLSRREMDYE